MSEAELIFTAPLAELSTPGRSPRASPLPAWWKTRPLQRRPAWTCIAKKARLELEAKTKRKVVTGENYLPPPQPAKQIK